MVSHFREKGSLAHERCPPPLAPCTGNYFKATSQAHNNNLRLNVVSYEFDGLKKISEANEQIMLSTVAVVNETSVIFYL